MCTAVTWDGMARNACSFACRAKQMAVITPYSGQRKHLQESLVSHESLRSVEVDSVDSFQGREKDVIIFSCVRSNPRGSKFTG